MLVVLLVSVAFGAAALWRLRFNYNFNDFYPQGDPELAYYERYIQTFGTDNDYILVGLEAPGGRVFTTRFLTRVDSLTRYVRARRHVRAEKKNSVMKAVFASRLNALTMAFFQIIANKNREAIIDAIADQFVIQYERLKGVERATIITTMPLTDPLREQFKAIVMKNTTGKSVELEEKIDPKLIGGYILRVGDQQIDGSIRSQLNDIRLQFLN